MPGPFDVGRQTCSLYSLRGTEDEAEQLAMAEFTRIERELGGDEDSDTPKESKVFTAYLYPLVSSIRTRASDLIPVHFAWDNRDLLAEMMKAEVEGLYVTGGRDRAVELLDLISLATRLHVVAPDAVAGAPPSALPNAVAFESSDEALKAGNQVWRACFQALRDLDKRTLLAVKSVEAAAATLAVARLREAAEQIAGEAPRYLMLRERRGAGEELVDSDIELGELILQGPGVVDLLDALRDLHRARRTLDSAAAAFARRKQDPAIVSELALMTGAAGGLFGPVVDENAVTARAYPAEALALQIATTNLAQMLAVHAKAAPILYRIWNGPELPWDVAALESGEGAGTLVSSTAAGRVAIDYLKQTIWTSLRETWEANHRLVARIESDSSLVWRYPPAVSAGLDELRYLSPSVEFKAAQERLDEEHGTSTAARLGQVNGALQIGAALAGAAPPVGVVLACISLALGAFDRVHEFIRLREQEEDAMAVLDPSRALASEPEYLGLIAGVAFLVLDLKGVHDALGAARFAEQVSTGKTAIEVAGP